MSHDKYTNEKPEEDYGYDQADQYREETGPMNVPPFRGNPQEGYRRTGSRSRMSNPQGHYQGGPRGYSGRYRMDHPANPREYEYARGYDCLRRDYHHNDHNDYYYDDYHDYDHHDHNDCHHEYGSSKRRGWFDRGYLNNMMKNPMTNNFFRGVGVATIAVLLAPSLARALKPLAVQAVHGVTSIVDELKGVVSEAREDIEDIFADGKWSNMEHDDTMKQPPTENQ